MMTLVEKILVLYPDLDKENFHPIRGTIIIQNDGAEDYIQKWEHPTLSQPTQEQLDKGQL